MKVDDFVRLARTLRDMTHLTANDAVTQLGHLIPDELRVQVREALEADDTILVRDLRMLQDPTRQHREWLRFVDRQNWHYWPRLRNYLIDRKGWPLASVQSVEEASDAILAELESPSGIERFDSRGLVVGYVQSGKTANYTALIAKAADAGYRLVIVLAGIHDSLRQQTQRRLNAELVGGSQGGVPLPPEPLRWHTLTTGELTGDFQPGTTDATIAFSSHPVLVVMKKNARVLERFIEWLGAVPRESRERIPVLVIDDEADQASVNTKGNRTGPAADDDEPDDGVADAEPSRINLRIRELLRSFSRVAYVGYTATPFANVLIDHEADDLEGGQDLYPRDFIVALPQPHGYYGAERIFGSSEDAASPEMDVIRLIPDDEVDLLIPAPGEADSFRLQLSPSLREAIDDFVLAGAARFQRNHGDQPATMLIHTTYRRALHQQLFDLVAAHMAALRNEWRYSRDRGLDERLGQRWEGDFRRVTRREDISLDASYEELRPHIGAFLEYPVDVLQINSSSDQILDYQRDPALRAIVVGGNRLSRGLTLEGLMVSYYVRRAQNYDTLMQMGRWFGFRDGYADLTRIYMTGELAGWFRDLVAVEEDLREDIRRYEDDGLTPLLLAPRIRTHPAMLVTDRLKSRKATVSDATQFTGRLVQTINFPFGDHEWLRHNLEATARLLERLGPSESKDGVGGAPAFWRNVPWELVVDFLDDYRMDRDATRVRADPLRRFIRRQVREKGEIGLWIVGVMGQGRHQPHLGPQMNLGIAGGLLINPIERTRLSDQPNSVKAITSPDDQALGLSSEEIQRAHGLPKPIGPAYRDVRDPRTAVLMIYPISRYSGWKDGIRTAPDGRVPLFDPPESGVDVIGVACAFPHHLQPTTAYMVGTVGAGPDLE